MAGLLGLRLAFLHPHVAAVRPAIGVALAACLLLGARVWPGVFLGTFLVRILTLGTVAPTLGIACGNALTVLLGTHLVRRLANGCHAFDRAPDIFRFTGRGQSDAERAGGHAARRNPAARRSGHYA